MRIPIAKPYFTKEEKENLIKPLETGWVVQGPYVDSFENSFRDYTKSKFSFATTSCTTSLHLALVALGIKSGDKVIIPSFTYIATANVVEQCCAELVFCDISLDTFNIDETKLEKLILENDNVKAIIPVHLFGLAANMPQIKKISEKYGLKVIEDAACGFDTWINNKHVGNFSDVGCFSFHPRKSICTGEGGMIVTNKKSLARKIEQLRDHGASKSDIKRHFEKGGSLLPNFNFAGFNYRMTDFQGALGVSQMKKADKIMSKKRKIVKKYLEELANCENIKLPSEPKGYKHSYQSFVCLFTNGEDLNKLTKKKIDFLNKKRNVIMSYLEEKGISTRQGTHAVHTLGFYKKKYKLKNKDYINSYAADRLSIALPLYVQMTNEEFDYIIKNLKKIL